MLLHAHEFGTGPAVVILHGLMGSGANWQTIAKKLATQYQVFCLDLPNHGLSPPLARHTLRDVTEAVMATMTARGIQSFVVVGHSYGGKVAMQLASDYAARLRGLVVVDIAPVAFKPFHLFVLRACQQLRLDGVQRRQDLDQALARYLPDAATRAFLLKNVARDDNHHFQWRIPLQYLIDNYRAVSDAPPLTHPYPQPTLFLAGANSYFKVHDHEALIRHWFPAMTLHTIAAAGHLIHLDQPQLLLQGLNTYLQSVT